MTPSRFCGTIHAYEAALFVAVCVAVGVRSRRRRRQPGARSAPPTPATGDTVAEAYDAVPARPSLEETTTIDGAIAAYKRAMELDPTAADMPAELAGLYLRQNKVAGGDRRPPSRR